MARVVVTDYTFDSLDVERAVLEPLGVELAGRPRCDAQELGALVAEADCVITQFAPITAAVIGAMRRTRAIVRYGVGVDNVDLDAARARGIPVCNVPDYCIDEVADHTLAFILALTRQVVANTAAVRAGRWRLAVPLPEMLALRDMTVGVVGFGRIGRAVAQRLAAFRPRLLVHDPLVPAVDVGRAGCSPVTLPELLAACDLVTLHCPSTVPTRRLLNRESIARMQPGALLVNVGRGDLVDTAALIDALQQGHLRGAALDVCDPEPVPPESPLLKLENVLITAHIASASVKAVRTLRETAAQLAARAVRGEPLPNVVNGVPAGPPGESA
jgi:D-3-phosphoglycerate dehydrogenase